MTTKELEQRAEEFAQKLFDCSSDPGEHFGGKAGFIAGAESQAVITEKAVRQEIWKLFVKRYSQGERTALCDYQEDILSTSEVGKL